MIQFCSHAKIKFIVLKGHGFPISRKQVVETVKKAERVEKGEKGRLISQKRIDDEHVLRVIHEKVGRNIVVITFYPGRRKHYES